MVWLHQYTVQFPQHGNVTFRSTAAYYNDPLSINQLESVINQRWLPEMTVWMQARNIPTNHPVTCHPVFLVRDLTNSHSLVQGQQQQQQ